MQKNLLIILIMTLAGSAIHAQPYSYNDFVGTWSGTISSQWSFYNDPITMSIYPNGTYDETLGHLMPTIYPNTQQCEYESSTNRFHWWYLMTVYAGQYTYSHSYYEIVYFNNDTLEMHYNFWDDPVPNPDAGRIFLVKQTSVGLGDDPIKPVLKKKLTGVYDLNGRKVNPQTTNRMVIYHYDDGSAEKKLIHSR